MKKLILSFVFALSAVNALSQKTLVSVVKTDKTSGSGWQILNDRFFPVTKDEEFSADTALLTLEANNRYFLFISVPDSSKSDTTSFSLSINSEPVILIGSDILPGDHFFPFYTGIKADTLSKITGGSDASISDFPWQVYIRTNSFTCGGSIIDNRWIITAAHCTVDDNDAKLPASSFTIRVGANNPRLASDGKNYFVSDVIIHEKFDPVTLNNDLALLRLTEPVNYPNAVPVKIISPVDSARGATDPGVYTWITGYGMTVVEPPTYPNILQKAQIPIVSNAQASTVWPKIPESDMMAGFKSVTRDACAGDSGGPLVVPVDNAYKLAGIVSWGSSKCNTYGAYTRLSLFENWIIGKTGIEITFRAPVPKGDSIICPGTSSSIYRADPVANATSYNWSIVPAEAGTLNVRNELATITWNPGFYGPLRLQLKVARGTEISEMSGLVINVARQTRILNAPASVEACAEKPVSLKIDAEGYNLQYKWFRDFMLVPSETTNEFSITSAVTDDSGNYYCQISGSCGSISSQNISLTVRPVTRIKEITPDTVVTFGDDLLLNVKSDGYDLYYQWFKNGALLEGEADSRLIVRNTDASDIGLYNIMITGTCGTVTSENIYAYIVKSRQQSERELLVWPSVVDDVLSVAVEGDKKYNIFIFSSSGRLVREILNASYVTAVNIGWFPSGLYLVTVMNDDFRKSIKIIKR